MCPKMRSSCGRDEERKGQLNFHASINSSYWYTHIILIKHVKKYTVSQSDIESPHAVRHCSLSTELNRTRSISRPLWQNILTALNRVLRKEKKTDYLSHYKTCENLEI